MLRLLLQGIGLHLVEGDANDQARLRSSVEQASTAMDEATEPNQYLVEAGTVIQALQDYTCRSTQVIHQGRTELQTMVGMLAKTVQSVAAETGDSVSRLQELEKHLAGATQIEDIRLLRLKLND